MQDLTNIKISKNTKIKAFPLTLQPARKGKIFIGSKKTNSFIIVDEYWKPIVKLLKKEISIDRIIEKLSETDSKNFPVFQAETRVKLLAVFLAKYKLLEKIDGEDLYKDISQDKILVSQKSAKIFTKNWVFFILLFFAMFAFFIPLFSNSGVLNPSNFFWSMHPSLSLISYILFTSFMIATHEFSHYLVARANGVSGSFSFSNRLNFLVLESKFPNMYSIPKVSRILVFSAGTLTDLAITGVLYIFLYLGPSLGISNLILAIIKQFILLEWIAIFWQFLFYMKTDFYFVIKEIVGVENLYTYAKQKVQNIGRFKSLNLPLNRGENIIVSLYAVLFLAGSAFGIIRYLTFHLPITIRVLVSGVNNFWLGIQNKDLILLLDGFFVVLVESLLVSLLTYVFLKKDWIRRIFRSG